MKAKTLLGALLTVGLSLAVVAPAADVHAQGKKKKEDVSTAEPPAVKKALTFALPGVTWGMTPAKVADRIDAILDDDYRPLYKEVQPGVRMKELDAQLAEEKAAFRRSRVDFGKLPTGYDATPLRGEYTYNNKECVYKLDRKGMTTWIFFIQERLWKVIEEHKLSEKHPLGKTYQEAVIKMTTDFGVPGRFLQPDGTNRFAIEVDWKDATTHLRAIQRTETAMGMGYEDNATVANLASLRPNKPAQDNGIDPDVAGIVRNQPPPPPPEKDKKK